MKIDKNDLKLWMIENNIPSITKLKNKTEKYIINKNWYTKSKDQIEFMFNSSSELFIDLLAITSQRSTVRSNVINTLHAFYSIQQDKPLNKSYGIADKWIKQNINRLLSNEPYSGQKINAFAEALKGDLNSIVIDVWMMKVFNINRKAPTKRDLKFMVYLIKEIAKRLELKPAEVQACLWCYGKYELNDTGFREYYDFSHYLKLWNQRILKEFTTVQTKLF